MDQVKSTNFASFLSILDVNNVSYQMTKFLNQDKSRFYKIIQLRLPPKPPGKYQHYSHLVFCTKIFLSDIVSGRFVRKLAFSDQNGRSFELKRVVFLKRTGVQGDLLETVTYLVIIIMLDFCFDHAKV